MSRIEKGQALKDLESWFGKSLTGAQFEKILNRIDTIPIIAFRDIVNRLTDDSPPMPSRFPTMEKIFEYWRIWLLDHPQAAALPVRTDCRQCGSAGFLWMTRIEASNRYEYVYRCNICDNWRREVGNSAVIPFWRNDSY